MTFFTNEISDVNYFLTIGISAVDDFILPMRSKQCITNGKSVWIAGGYMLKNEPHLDKSHEYIGQSMNISVDS